MCGPGLDPGAEKNKLFLKIRFFLIKLIFFFFFTVKDVNGEIGEI